MPESFSSNVSKIPVSKIVALPDTQLRFALNEDRVNFFAELYKDKEHKKNIPPILCLRQNGTLALADGSHRLEAQRRLSISEVLSNIKDYTGRGDLISEEELKRKILIASYTLNDKHSLPLSTEERKEAVRKMYNLGVPLKKLKEFVPGTTLNRWLADKIAQRNADSLGKQLTVEKLKCKGKGAGSISRTTGINKNTVKTIARRSRLDSLDERFHNKKGFKVPSGILNPPSSEPLENKGLKATEADTDPVKNPQNPVEKSGMFKLKSLNRGMASEDWSKEEQKYMVRLVKSIAKISLPVQSLLRGDMHLIKNEELSRENKELSKSIRLLSKSNFDIKEKNEALRKSLRDFKDKCKTSCKGQGAIAELHHAYVSAMVESLEEWISLVNKPDAEMSSCFERITHSMAKRIINGGIDTALDRGIDDRRTKDLLREVKRIIKENPSMFKSIKFINQDGKSVSSDVLGSLRQLDRRITDFSIRELIPVKEAHVSTTPH